MVVHDAMDTDRLELAIERPVDLAEAVRIRLRDLILKGYLAPGTVLRQEHLASQFGVSRTPLKQAIAQLASEGLVTLSAGSTASVVKLSRDDALELLEVRELIDGLVGRKLAQRRPGASFVAEAQALISVLERAIKDENRFDYIQGNHDFHVLLLHEMHHHEEQRLLPTVRLSTYAIYLQDWTDRTARLESSVEEHRSILSAICDGDAERAEALSRAHVHNAAQFWVSQP